MLSDVIVSLLVFFPLLAALFVFLIPSKAKELAKNFSLYVSLMNFGISVLMFSKFQNIDGFQFLVNVPWNTDLGISYKVGIDGINIFLVMITTFFIPVAILSTWDKIKEKERVFYSSILMLESFLIGSVVSIDLFLFYVFWELMLIPMFFMVGIWSESKNTKIVSKFFVYTMIGSLAMLFSILYIYQSHYNQTGFYTFDILNLYSTSINPQMASILFFSFLIAFAIKAPLFPFHTWLPDTYTDAPVSGTILLSFQNLSLCSQKDKIPEKRTKALFVGLVGNQR